MRRKVKPPLIGVSGPSRGGYILWWFTRLAVVLAGGRPRRITPTMYNAPLDRYDGFILVGGGDINPQLYGESALMPDKQYDIKRDTLEQQIVHYAMTHHIPLLGICRGMQMLNIALGGSLYQEAKEVLEDFLPSENLLSKFVGRRDVRVKSDTMLFHILGKYQHYRVNSIHHQAVNQLGNGLKISAYEENKLVQAVEQDEKSEHPFLIGVQWHPELMLHARSARQLFYALVNAAKA